MLRLNKTKAEAFKIAYSFPGVNSYLLKVLTAIRQGPKYEKFTTRSIHPRVGYT